MTRVTFEGRRYPVQRGESALDALLRGGAGVRFSCRKGSCHACVLQATEGDPGEGARRTLPRAMREGGYFLPCAAFPDNDLTARRPDPSALYHRALVSERGGAARDVVRFVLEPAPAVTWRAGQYVNVRHPSGAARSYSIASVLAEDVFITLYVRRVPNGVVSRWLCDEVGVGDEVELQGPMGACHFRDGDRARPLLLLATGTGLGPLLGLAREALAAGHHAPVRLYHGARSPDDLLLRAEALRLATEHPTLSYTACVSGSGAALPAAAVPGRVTDVAFRDHADLTGWAVYACGLPAMVFEARARAVAAGASRGDILTDPYTPSAPFVPDDARKLAGVAPDPELWRALRSGDGLTEILTDFYGRVFDDPRLAPFFERVSRQRAIEKQYEFLRGVFSGEPGYLGLNPFNAHHWMVISDELFDHRERLLEECMTRYGLPAHLRQRWAAVHETFRQEIVKAAPRGMFVRGVERAVEGYTDEEIAVATVCDGCCAEMPAGARGRLHVRTGKLFCRACDAKHVGTTGRPARIDPA